MLSVFYEDCDVIVVKKPAGLESQVSRGFAPDMVSEVRRYLGRTAGGGAGRPGGRPHIGGAGNGLSTELSTSRKQGQAPYVGVIHRLDKPVSGLMVYAKNQKAAASLSAELQAGRIGKVYRAVVCGKPVDNLGTYVDYLRQDRRNNVSEIVDKSVEGAKRAELNYRVLQSICREGREYSLVEIELLTGRHHQIRVQFAGRGTPLVGDQRYGGAGAGCADTGSALVRVPLALCACRLSFDHPVTGKRLAFEMEPEGGAFAWEWEDLQ